MSHSTSEPSGTSTPRMAYGESTHRLHDPAQIDFHPSDQEALVVAISLEPLHPGKLLCEWQEQGSASLLIGALGSCHFDGQQIALAVDESVPFASPDFL